MRLDAWMSTLPRALAVALAGAALLLAFEWALLTSPTYAYPCRIVSFYSGGIAYKYCYDYGPYSPRLVPTSWCVFRTNACAVPR